MERFLVRTEMPVPLPKGGEHALTGIGDADLDLRFLGKGIDLDQPAVRGLGVVQHIVRNLVQRPFQSRERPAIQGKIPHEDIERGIHQLLLRRSVRESVGGNMTTTPGFSGLRVHLSVAGGVEIVRPVGGVEQAPATLVLRQDDLDGYLPPPQPFHIGKHGKHSPQVRPLTGSEIKDAIFVTALGNIGQAA